MIQELEADVPITGGEIEHVPPKGAILFIGSSSIRKWNTLADDFPDRKVINRGFGGSHIIDSVHFADRIVWPYEPPSIARATVVTCTFPC